MIQLYWVALKTIWIKEVTRFGRIWVQTLIPPVITMSLYFVIFGNLIGKRIGDMGGVDYMLMSPLHFLALNSNVVLKNY